MGFLARAQRLARWCCVGCGLFGAGGASAMEWDSIAVMADYVDLDDGRRADSGVGGASALIGLRLAETVVLEPSVYWTVIDRPQGAADKLVGAGVDARWNVRSSALQPFLIGGLGGEYADSAYFDHSTLSPSANLGVGLHAALPGGLGLRAEVRRYFVFDGGDFGKGESADFRLRLGIEYRFGGSASVDSMPAATTSVVPVAQPAADEVPVVTPLTPSLPSPTTVSVAPIGPAAACASVSGGFKVDVDGCLLPQTTPAPGINFIGESDQLTSIAQQNLAQLARALADRPQLTLTVVEYANPLRALDSLSTQRANAICLYLVRQGVEARRLTAGERGSRSVGPNSVATTAEARWVQLHLEAQ